MPGLLDFLGMGGQQAAGPGGLLGRGQPMQAQVPGQARAQSIGQGLLGGLGDAFEGFSQFSEENPGALMALSAGLMRGDMAAGIEGMGSVVARNQAFEREREGRMEDWNWQRTVLGEEDRQQRVAEGSATAKFLQAQGAPRPYIDLANAGRGAEAWSAWNDFQKTGVGDRQFQELPDGTYGYFDENAGEFVKLGSAPKPAGSGMSMRLPDGTEINLGGKLPSGFQPDPQNPGSLMPIPGGPGEQISGELAARLGMAENFIKDSQELRPLIERGDVTGPYDRAQAANNQSTSQAKVYRNLQSGTDALQRMLTGAGMPAAEAEAYARRYLPTYTDDATSATVKLDQLVEELKAVKAKAERGRGGRVEKPMTYDDAARRTRSGLTWSAQ